MVTESDGVELDLPVSLAPQWNVGDVARVVSFVKTAERDLGSVLALGGVAKVESKDRLIQKLLVEHVVEWRWDSVDTDSVITETQDAVESAESKSKTWLSSGFSEELILDCQVTNGDGILRDVAAERARAVSDLEFRSILLVC